MLVRFGYVAMSVHVKNASPSKTMTFAQFSKIPDREAALRKLERIAQENLNNTLRLLKHNRAHEIRFYRFSSKLIPLIGHQELGDWDPIPSLRPDFQAVGDYVKEHEMRVGFHPDHFTVLSTPKADILRTSIEDLVRHDRMLDAMGLDRGAKLNIHIGGAYGNRETTFERFIAQFEQVPADVRDRIILENDDKTFTAKETLEACRLLGLPMTLDLHHDQVNPSPESPLELWPSIVRTWEGQSHPPKIHVSSPKSESDPRGHADYVESKELLRFFKEIAPITPALDVMIEAKKKDDALFRLMQQLSADEDVRQSEQASIEIRA